MHHHDPATIARTTGIDLMQLASDLPDSPVQVAAVLVLDGATGVDLDAVTDALGARVPAVPRLRQRLVFTPVGAGRPIWVDDAAFDVRRHVRSVRCPAPGDETALLAVVARAVTQRLPADRPLWSATLVTGLEGEGAALVVTLHHVVADGVGGLAVLTRLVDGAPPEPAPEFPRPAPGYRALVREALLTRMRALWHLRDGARRLRAALAGVVAGRTAAPPRSSLNRPIGTRRRLAVARADLSRVRRTAHEHSATVNDVVLTAVTGALREVLRHRGEQVDEFVVSVPVSGRDAATPTHLGNQVGVMAVPVTVHGDRWQRLATIARTTRGRRPAGVDAAAVLGPVFRTLARLGVMRWFVDRQRLVTTFVTNVRGPDVQLSFLGARITDVIPVSSLSGNVTVSFTVLSYAGTLVVTAVADPQRCPDLTFLVQQLQDELDLLLEPR